MSLRTLLSPLLRAHSNQVLDRKRAFVPARRPNDNVVLALSTALPREQMIHGRPVLTSIVRDHSCGPINFGERGPENNRTAVHAEQVLAFSARNYEYWAKRLRVERASWPWAYWGENITVCELDEHALMVGDRVRMGPVLFQVTAPRTPCFKLAWRLGQPDSFLKDLVNTGLVGVYLKVIEPGSLKAGDKVSIEPGLGKVSVATVARLIGALKEDELDLALKVLKLSELGGTARLLLGHRVNDLQDALRCRTNRWQGWRTFKISKITDETPEVRSIVLKPVDNKPLAAYRAGQHINARLTAAVGNRRSKSSTGPIRSWSLSRFDAHPVDYRLTIKHGTGDGSRWIHEAAKVGDKIELRAPAGHFVLNRGSFFRPVLVSVGVGVTPMLSMLKAHGERGTEAPALHWLHSTRNSMTHVLRNEVEQLLAVNPRFVRQIHYTQPNANDDPNAFDEVGRITADTILKILKTPFTAGPRGEVGVPGEYSEFYVCGPDDFITMVRETLNGAGLPHTQVLSESFATPERKTESGKGRQSARIRFARSGVDAVWEPIDDLTLLELAEEVGLTPDFACRRGTCGTCTVKLLKGAVAYDPPLQNAPAPGECLTCCARPTSAEVVLDV